MWVAKEYLRCCQNSCCSEVRTEVVVSLSYRTHMRLFFARKCPSRSFLQNTWIPAELTNSAGIHVFWRKLQDGHRLTKKSACAFYNYKESTTSVLTSEQHYIPEHRNYSFATHMKKHYQRSFPYKLMWEWDFPLEKIFMWQNECSKFWRNESFDETLIFIPHARY